MAKNVSYIIHDVGGMRWCGGDTWDEDNGRAARFSTLQGASEALCRLSPGTNHNRFPMYIARWRYVPKAKKR